MKKPIDLVKKKLDKYPISSLSIEELRIYFNHRLQKASENNEVLTLNELHYLLTETGPGDRRFDPRSITLLTDAKFFTSSLYTKISGIEDLLKKKQAIDVYVEKNKASEITQNLFLKTLSNYLMDVKITSNQPLVIEATFNNIPVSCIIKNGEWITPNDELFSFLKKTQTQKRFPLIVARKISGILFPLFKGISILGVNLYKTYLPQEARKMIEDVTLRNERPFISLKYNDQFQFLSKEYTEEIREEYWNGDSIHNFFENILPKNINTYYNNFLNTKINIGDNFIETVSQFKKNKGTKGLMNSYQAQENLLNSLKNSKN